MNEENSEDCGLKDQESKRRARKKKRMSCYDVAEIIVAKKIRTRTELLFFARQQKQEGKTDLAEFIINRGSKVEADVLQIAWEMEHSEETLKKQNKSRMELLYECLAEECSDGCNRQWITCAKDVLIRNGISVVKFARSIQCGESRQRTRKISQRNVGWAHKLRQNISSQSFKRDL